MAYATGTITALNGTVIPMGSAEGTYSVAVQSVSPNTLVIEGSLDNTNWYALGVSSVTTAGLGSLQATIVADGLYSVQAMDLIFLRVRASSYSSGTISIALYGDVAVSPLAVQNVAVISDSAALSPAKYTLVTASGNTTIKNSAGTLYGVIATANLGLTTFTLKDGSNTIIPSNALLNAAPNGIPFGPAGTSFTTNLVANLGGLLTSPVIVLYS